MHTPATELTKPSIILMLNFCPGIIPVLVTRLIFTMLSILFLNLVQFVIREG